LFIIVCETRLVEVLRSIVAHTFPCHFIIYAILDDSVGDALRRAATSNLHGLRYITQVSAKGVRNGRLLKWLPGHETSGLLSISGPSTLPSVLTYPHGTLVMPKLVVSVTILELNGELGNRLQVPSITRTGDPSSAFRYSSLL
jgi:hypothetical protein